MNRRDFLHMLGLFSSATLATSCGSDTGQRKLISYLVPPEDGVTPGEALWFDTTCTECPAHCGMMVRVREGRPVKVEGVTGHPVSDGGLCIRGQSILYRLYHPQRLKTPLRREADGELREIGWDQAFDMIADALHQAKAEGRGNIYLAGRTTGTLGDLIDLFGERLGIERHAEFEPYAHSALRQGYQALFGRAEIPHYRFAESDFLFTLGADLLDTFVSPVDFAGQFAQAIKNPEFRWMHAEPHYSLTGANAHQRLVITPGTEANLLAYLLRELAESGRYGNRLPAELLAAVPVFSPEEVSRSTGIEAARLADLLTGFEKAQRPLLIAGGPATAHADGFITAVLAGLIQWLTGMTEESVNFARAENYRSVGSPGDAQGLAERLENGEVGVLFIARANPLYHLPAFSADTLGKARLRIGLYDVPDETAAHLDLLLPLSHPLETWGDVQPRAGVRSILRPVVGLLGDSRSEGDILLGILRLAGQEIGAADFREFLFAQWRRELDDKSQQDFSRQGYLAAPVQPSRLSLNAAEAAAVFGNWQPGAGVTGPVLVVSPSIRAFDGRSRPLHLLSEIPDPLTTVSYGRWVAVSPSTAERGGMKDGDGLKLIANGWETVLAVKIQPGLTDEIFMIKWESLEQSPQTVDRSSGELNPYIGGLRWERTRRADPIAILAGSTSQHGRGIIPDPVHREEKHHEQYTLYPAHDHPDYQWGMAIDLQLCIGCGACAASCYVENNVPVTGIRDHLRGRELSWLRIEPFYDETGRVGFIPMLCQHCEFAPCEPVCPVYAAYHNPEGLNIQVYARCVGTRYCSHNCPYKVRRFNWWDYRREPPLDRMLNPDLTVRKRGTMEKCTFCIQRIRTARDRAKDDGRKIQEGEVTTACAQSCPTGAIVFGNFLDEDSRVYQLAHSERAYRVFEDLGTESSIYYLKKAGDRSQESGKAKG